MDKNKQGVCTSCQKGNCKNCEKKWSCKCKCNENGAADITQKVLATTAGVGVAVGGLVLTVLSGGLAIPVGGALMGLKFYLFNLSFF